MAKYTTEQIINQFKSKHGDLFDYSLVCYVNGAQKVSIICKEHGVFEQSPAAHKRGQGCAKCMYDSKRGSLDEALQRFKDTHGSRYDYSLVNYRNVDSKVKIICAEHGVFLQTPYSHAIGNGCPKCIGRHKTQDEVIELFRLAHGDRYDYSQVVFARMNNKINIICREHGIFSQSATNHAAGQGCVRCAGNYQYSTQEIVDKFKGVHGATYDYSLTEYIGNDEKVSIVCRIHGQFNQVVYSHLSGSGCPDCYAPIGHSKNSYVEYCNQYEGNACLYLIHCYSGDELFFKIGISRLGAKSRFPSYGKMPYDYELIREICGSADSMWDLEKELHDLLCQHKHKPLKDFSGKTECFTKITKEAIDLIDSYNTVRYIDEKQTEEAGL